MSKWMLRLGSLLVAMSLLVSCSTGNDNNNNNAPINQEQEANDNQSNASEQSEAVVTIKVSLDRGEEIVSEKEVNIESGAILMDVMKENFDIEETGGMITAIEGNSQDEDKGKYWVYTVNGEMAMVGANDYKLEPGDEVEFDLQAWEE